MCVYASIWEYIPSTLPLSSLLSHKYARTQNIATQRYPYDAPMVFPKRKDRRGDRMCTFSMLGFVFKSLLLLY